MKTFKHLFLLLAICFSFSLVYNVSKKPAEIFAGIGYYHSTHGGSAKGGLVISAGNMAVDACAAGALAGSGITLGGSIVVGLVIGA
jgi:hypothetical protein